MLAVLTMVLLLLHAPGIFYTQVPLIAFVICGLVKRELARLPLFWFSVSGLIVLDLMVGWFYVDNHKFVELYWCLTLAVVTASPPELRKKIFANNSRWILAAVMLFAVLWKAISVSYTSGAFFEFTLLTDERFQNMANWFGGVGYDTLASNRESLGWFRIAHLKGEAAEIAAIESSVGVQRLAFFMTWWTIFIEALIGVLYLIPKRVKNIGAIRDYALLSFAATTYLFAPVVGFGWLLMMMGAAQTESRFRFRLFCIAFVVIQVYELPYANLVNQFLTN